MSTLTGLALREAVATKVMGLTGLGYTLDGHLVYTANGSWHYVPPYESNMTAAWQVVEKMRAWIRQNPPKEWLTAPPDERCEFKLMCACDEDEVLWRAGFGVFMLWCDGPQSGCHNWKCAPTAPEAIGLAALATMAAQ